MFERFREAVPRLYSAVLADVLDALGHRDRALPGEIVALDPSWKLFGKVRTLSMKRVEGIPDQPYATELEAIDDLKPGDVLVIRMAGCPPCAVWGELLSTAAKARGAVGAVMDGPTRDVEKILALGFPTFAAGANPLDSKGRIDGESRDKPVTIGKVICRPGDFLFGDRDGVVVVPQDVAPQALSAALEKVGGENRVRSDLAAGRSAREVFAQYGIL